MSRILVFFAVAVVAVAAAAALAVSSASASHSARVGSPNFVCISTPYFGVCIGPPTKQGLTLSLPGRGAVTDGTYIG